tara:strand:+ start:42042 stop:43997 length:1956 start_codon:yes stop_codon:yes gene_type:complete
MPRQTQNLFQRLTQLFRAGPIIKRKVRNFAEPGASTALELFQRAHSDVYNSTLSAYGAFDRMSRYSDFSEMEATPEIASALDIYSEETVSPDERGRVLHIYSENRRIHELLDNLFYDILNVEFNLVMWVRNLCKYGDFFLFNDISPEYGVINAFPIAISEIEREENFDPNNPAAVRFRWMTQGNTVLENWQVSHFRLLGNDAFLPYGTSVLESARRIWRQLILIEDAMLVYRVIRAPERRVFYIDVGNVPPEDVATYLQQAQTSLKRSQVVDKTTGKVDLRYNPLSVDEDYFLPVRGGESGTRIDTLAGGQNTAAIEDVEYIQKKLFAALKIPRAYLGYDEEVGAKATLAQEDIRFSRSIQRIQKTVISELNKLAMIHLYCHGYEGDDLIDFELALSNPSSIAQQQKLELIRTRFEIAAAAPEGVVDRYWIRKNVMGLTDLEVERIEEGREEDKVRDSELENVSAESPEAGAPEPEGEAGGGLFSADEPQGQLLIAKSSEEINETDETDDEEDDDDILKLSLGDLDAPAKAEKQIRNVFNEPLRKSRKVTSGPASTHMPNLAKMASVGGPARKQDSMNQPYDAESLKNPFGEGLEDSFMNTYLDTKIGQNAKMTFELENTLGNLGKKLGLKKKVSSLLAEDVATDGENENE